MKTSKELAQIFRSIESADVLGFFGSVLIPHLEYVDAKGWLKDGVTSEDWIELQTDVPLTRDDIIEEMRDYMEFAWDKCEGERGISASRSVDKFAAWLLILDDELWKELQTGRDFCPYGAPLLAKISQKYDFHAPFMIHFSEHGTWANPYKVKEQD